MSGRCDASLTLNLPEPLLQALAEGDVSVRVQREGDGYLAFTTIVGGVTLFVVDGASLGITEAMLDE